MVPYRAAIVIGWEEIAALTRHTNLLNITELSVIDHKNISQLYNAAIHTLEQSVFTISRVTKKKFTQMESKAGSMSFDRYRTRMKLTSAW